MVIERRKERRIKADLPVKITYPDNFEVIGRTKNISRLGAYLEADREIPAGIELDITLEIPAYTENLSLAGKARCKGNIFRCDLLRVVESKKYYGIGVFFTDFTKQIDRDKLSSYINYLILKERQDIEEGIKRWRGKRNITKMTKQAQEIQVRQEEFQTEVRDLLKQILIRLEEISHLLQSQDKN